MEGYNIALNIIPLLYSSGENLFTTITIGNIIQSLLDKIDNSPNVSPVTRAKRSGLNVSFEEITVNDQKQSFDFEYFWRNIRSKHAHVTVLSLYGIEEPSQEIARKSVGLLCTFLKTYPTCVSRIENKRST